MRPLSAIVLACALLSSCAKTTSPISSIAPSSTTPGPKDFIELMYGGSKVLPFTVRVYGDGLVSRDTTADWGTFVSGCPLSPADQTLALSKDQAQALINAAEAEGFFSWNDSYSASKPVLDAGLTQLVLSVGGRRKAIEVHAGQPPDAFWKIADQLRASIAIPSYAEWRNEDEARQNYCSKVGREVIHREHQTLFP